MIAAPRYAMNPHGLRGIPIVGSRDFPGLGSGAAFGSRAGAPPAPDRRVTDVPHGSVLGFVPLPPGVVFSLAGITLLYVASTEWLKARFYGDRSGGGVRA